MTDQNVRTMQCRFCGVDITHFDGRLYHEYPAKVFPQYCRNTDPEKASILHEPKTVSMLEYAQHYYRPLQYPDPSPSSTVVTPEKDVKPVQVDTLTDSEVRGDKVLAAMTSAARDIGVMVSPLKLISELEFRNRFPISDDMLLGLPLQRVDKLLGLDRPDSKPLPFLTMKPEYRFDMNLNFGHRYFAFGKTARVIMSDFDKKKETE